METIPPSQGDLHALAHELFEQFAHLGHGIHPDMRNAAHGEMAVIRTIHLAIEQGEPALTPGAIAERSHLSSARTANVLRSLEEKGWVSREHDTNDRRRVIVTLTPAGEAERLRRRREFESQAEAFLSRLGEADTREAIRILKRCNQILAQDQHQEGGAPDEDPQAL